MPKKLRATQRRRPEKRSLWAWLVKPVTFQLAVLILKIVSMIFYGWGDR